MNHTCMPGMRRVRPFVNNHAVNVFVLKLRRYSRYALGSDKTDRIIHQKIES